MGKIKYMKSQNTKKILSDIANAISGLFSEAKNDRGEPFCDENYPEFLENTSFSPQTLSLQAQKHFIKMPLISIVTYIENESECNSLQKTVDACLCQSYSCYEVIVAKSSCLKLNLSKNDKLTIINSSESGAALLNEAVKKASGDYLLIIPPADIISPAMLYEVVFAINKYPIADLFYTDNDSVISNTHTNPQFKPDVSIDTLLSYNYIDRSCVFRTAFYRKLGGHKALSPQDEYDIVLRAAFYANEVVHIPKVLYSRGTLPDKINAPLMRNMIDALVMKRYKNAYTASGMWEGSFRVHYPFPKRTCVGIIIFNCESYSALSKTLESIEDCTTFSEYEITVIVTDNDAKLAAYTEALEKAKVISLKRFKPKTPLSVQLNTATEEIKSDIFCFLRCGVEILTPDWLEALTEHACRPQVGAVAPKVISSDNLIVSCGFVIGLGENGWLSSPYFMTPDAKCDARKNEFVNTVRNTTALNNHCIVIGKSSFTSIEGFDESFFGLSAFADICIRLCMKHYKNVYTPYAVVRVSGKCLPPDLEYGFSEDSKRCYDIFRSMLISGDENYNRNFDYKQLVPTVAAQPYPSVENNTYFCNKQ